MDMDDFLGWTSSSDDIRKHEEAYNKELMSGPVSSSTQFNYACFLIQSKYPGDVRRGISLLEELYQNPDESGKRDYVYFLAVGNARLKDYNQALQYINGLLAVERSNKQVQELKVIIEKRMRGEAVKGAAVAGGVLVGLGAIVGLGIASQLP
ncbi:mitochondrial fission 1 protein [Hyalella azteca]|uniref:Mitochondrial fission 1 protein n=1 Tax=Hyalella azteca TaxID=294128 RepID=A0A8B7NGP3_HYAAZ|nr:mitochondrial fission 1 protein [Hyalella azteca]